ncbi:MAG: Na+:solute symporter [Myxococcales bacterium]|nr:MAG: Na+:solute symporter [Myxococcales bacterium]
MLHTVDWFIIVVYLLLSLGIGLFYARKASHSKEDFFLSGRTLPWWLLGTSMAATNFGADAPLAITGLVAKQGIAGVWFNWCYVISWSLAIFFFARLWRRAHVLTDAEIVELRYSGKSAKVLRLFKGFYFGVLINCFVMAWMMVAMAKIMEATVGFPKLWTMLVFSSVAMTYTIMSGFWGVVVTDFFQYIIAIVSSLAFSVLAVNHVGGFPGLKEGLSQHYGSDHQFLNFLPDFSNTSASELGSLTASTFFVYVLVQWWAQKYSDGGGKHIQRMSSAKNEKHAMLGTLCFATMTYCLQFWPWIVTALVTLVAYPHLLDAEMGYPMLMMDVLPSGVLGLMLVSLIAAFMSTIDTHLNLGASYLVNDMYERFVHPNASQKHYVLVSRLSIVFLLALACVVAWQIDSVAAMWKFVISFTSGAGLTYIIRWLWWRANAWTEISGMIASAIIASYLKIAHPMMDHGSNMLIVTSGSALIWLTVTLLTPPVAQDVLVAFYERVQPETPFWSSIAKISQARYPSFPFRSMLIQFISGAVGMYAIAFGIGYLLLRNAAVGVLSVLVGVLILYVLVRKVELHSS